MTDRPAVETPRLLSDGVVTLRRPEDRDLDAIAAGIRDPDVVRWIGPPEGSAVEVMARWAGQLSKMGTTLTSATAQGTTPATVDPLRG